MTAYVAAVSRPVGKNTYPPSAPLTHLPYDAVDHKGHVCVLPALGYGCQAAAVAEKEFVVTAEPLFRQGALFECDAGAVDGLDRQAAFDAVRGSGCGRGCYYGSAFDGEEGVTGSIKVTAERGNVKLFVPRGKKV